ncbi:MAG: hypothetical protein OEV61_01885 [Chloroflexota bacterium]|jgi:hypothetical protein|nr:hypothetical protein [Chloroflexota bacterium]MDH5242850.1 hypothetical protein [Chloroflexota bacterium]
MIRARIRLRLLALAAMISLAACGGPSPGTASPRPAGLAASPPPASLPTPTRPTRQAPSPTLTAAAVLPSGSSEAAIDEAGITLPLPDGWQRLGAADLGDPAVRDGLAADYPGASAMLDAADAVSGRADLVFLAVAPTGQGAGTAPANVAVLTSQPPVSGLLLDIASGFIDGGFQDALGVGEPERTRLDTPVGEAIRLEYAMPVAGSAGLLMVAWVIGAPDATLLVTAMTPAGSISGFDPDAMIAGAQAR